MIASQFTIHNLDGFLESFQGFQMADKIQVKGIGKGTQVASRVYACHVQCFGALIRECKFRVVHCCSWQPQWNHSQALPITVKQNSPSVGLFTLQL